MYILWLGLLLAALLMFYNNQPIFKDYAEKSTAYTVREASQEGVQYACFEIVNAKIGESCSLAAEDFSLAECIKYFLYRNGGKRDELLSVFARYPPDKNAARRKNQSSRCLR